MLTRERHEWLLFAAAAVAAGHRTPQAIGEAADAAAIAVEARFGRETEDVQEHIATSASESTTPPNQPIDRETAPAAPTTSDTKTAKKGDVK